MGSFFGGGAKSAVDPAGTAYQQMGSPGGQSTIGKAIMNDPVHNFLFGGKPAYVMPTAGPWAGQAPSLAAANSGYGLNATGNPSLGGGGTSPQLAATFGQQPAAQRTPAAGPGQGFVGATQSFLGGAR